MRDPELLQDQPRLSHDRQLGRRRGEHADHRCLVAHVLLLSSPIEPPIEPAPAAATSPRPPPAALPAMSSRRIIPSNEVADAASYARARAAKRLGPHPVAASTRPPDVTTLSSRSAVPAWKTIESATAAAASRPWISSPVAWS